MRHSSGRIDVDFEWRVDRALLSRVQKRVKNLRNIAKKRAKGHGTTKPSRAVGEAVQPASIGTSLPGSAPTSSEISTRPYVAAPQPPHPPYAAHGSGPRKRSLMSTQGSDSGRSSKRHSFGSESQISHPPPQTHGRQMGPYMDSPPRSQASSFAEASRAQQSVNPEMQDSDQVEFPPRGWGVPAAMIPAQAPGGFQGMNTRANIQWPSSTTTTRHQFGPPASPGVSTALSGLSLTSQSQDRGTPRPEPRYYGDEIDSSDSARDRIPGGLPALQPQTRGGIGLGHGSSHLQRDSPGFTHGPRAMGHMPVPQYATQPPSTYPGKASYPSANLSTGTSQGQSGMSSQGAPQPAQSPEEFEIQQHRQRFQMALDIAEADENQLRLEQRMAVQEHGGGNPPMPTQVSPADYGAGWSGQRGSGSPLSQPPSEEYESGPERRHHGGRRRRRRHR